MKRALSLLVLAIAVAGCGGSVESGRGWELLDFSRSGPVYSVLLAQDQDEVDRIWDQFSLTSAKPEVDFDRRVVIGLGHAVSGSCPEIVFRGLVIENDRVYGQYRVGEWWPPFGGCNADAAPAMFWVAVDRDRLPDRFTLSLAKDRICQGCPEESAEIDLTDPTIPTPD